MTVANVLHAIHPDLIGRPARFPYPTLRKGWVSSVCRDGEHELCAGCYCQAETPHPQRHVWEGGRR